MFRRPECIGVWCVICSPTTVARKHPVMYAWRDMTTCIAARVIGNNSALIFCMDMKGSVDWSSDENSYKWLPLPRGFHALVAGPLSTAKELSWHCGAALNVASPLDPHEVMKALRKGIGSYKLAFADSHTQASLGIGYEEFRKRGKASFPEETCKEVSSEIKGHRSQADLIIAVFLPSLPPGDAPLTFGFRSSRRPYIFKVQSEMVSMCENFSAIGSGGYLAEASLFQRSQNFHQDAASTIYQIYEAKKLSEKADGVGQKTRIIVVHSDDTIQQVKDDGIQILEGYFQRFGLQKVAGVKLPPETFIKVIP